MNRLNDQHRPVIATKNDEDDEQAGEDSPVAEQRRLDDRVLATGARSWRSRPKTTTEPAIIAIIQPGQPSSWPCTSG